MEKTDLVLAALERIERSIEMLVDRPSTKEWYSIPEIAEILKKAEYTVREWCRQGRVAAKKKTCGRGNAGEWLVSHQELTRLRNEGLLPVGSQA